MSWTVKIALFVSALILSASSQGIAQEGFNSGDLALLQSIDEAKVELTVFLEPSANVLVGQQLDLVVEVATNTWFTGGTIIETFEVDGLIRLQREPFAINSSRRIGSETWSVQRWIINLYPQKEGGYSIPAFSVRTGVSSNAASVQSKEFVSSSKPLLFNAAHAIGLDAQAATNTPMLITPKLSLSEVIEGARTNLQVGDAITRIVITQAENLAAMMLPEPRFDAPSGIQVYKKPAILKDLTDRGTNLATRTDTVTYVIEEEGRYVLPEITFSSYQPANRELKLAALEALNLWTVGQENTTPLVIANTDLSPTNSSIGLGRAVWLIALLIVSILLIALWWRSRVRSNSSSSSLIKALEEEYKQHCANKRYTQASATLYRWLNLKHGLSLLASGLTVREFLGQIANEGILDDFESLMTRAHGGNHSRLPTAAADNAGVTSYEGLLEQLGELFSLHSDKCDNVSPEFKLN